MMGKKLERQGEKCRIWIVTILLAGTCILVCYFHVILRIGTIVTHIFYVPIILAAVWWKRKGLLVALFSSGFLIFSHVFLRPDVATHNDYVRALMFIVTAFVVAELSRRIAKEEEALRAANQQLSAEEQQLKAVNQQLKANEQKLHIEIAERKEAEGELQETTRFLETIFDTTHVLIAHMDPQFNFIKVNRAYALADEKEPSFFLGKNHFDLYPNEENEAIFRRVVETAESSFAEAKPFEYAEHPERGGSYWDWSLIPIKNQNNGVTGLVLSIINVTKRELAEKALRESEGKLGAMLQSIGDNMSMMDKDLNIIWANEKARNIFGDDIVGRKCYEVYHRRNKPCEPYPCLTLKAFQDGKFHEHDTQVVGKDGRNIYFHCTANVALRDANGKPKAVLEISSDITERKKAEQAIWASESEKKSILNAISDQLLFHDTDLTIRWCNEAAAISMGMTQRELIGCYCYELWHGRSEPCEQCPVLRAIETRSHTEGIMTTPDGKWWEVIGEPVCDRDGEIRGAIEIARDITERKKAEEALSQSEERLKILFESAPDAIYLNDLKGNIVDGNRAAEEMTGYKREELIGKNLAESGLLLPEQVPEVIARLEKNAMSEPMGPEEFTLKRKDGSYVTVEVRTFPVRIGNQTLSLGIARDISERKKAEEEIRKLSTAVEQSIDGIAIGDLEPKLIYVNDAFARIHGYAPEDMVGMPITNLHSKEQMDEYKKNLNQLKTQGSWEGEIGHIRKDGTAFPTYASFTLLKNSEGKPTRTLAIARDITESKRREEELNMSIYSEKMARAEQLASLGTLSATVAHELTQPLTVLRLLIENILTKLEATSSPETVTRRLKDSLTEVSNITSIVERFRNYARRSSDEIVGEIDLEAVGERIVKLLNESARRARITLHLNGMDKLPLVYSNEKDMEQLFFALADNAIQAADDKKSRQLIINGAVKNEHIELWFSDNCGGIAPDNIDKIFEPFFTTKPKGQGTGLGLCIVQSIVSRAGGKIRVESKFGEGSTFFVTLPTNKYTRS